MNIFAISFSRVFEKYEKHRMLLDGNRGDPLWKK
jgi:hypothetical protein